MEHEEIPFVGNPPITPQHSSVNPEKPSQFESNPSPVVGLSTPAGFPFVDFSLPLVNRPTPRRSSEEFLQRYVFYYIYEIFFVGLHVELH